MVRLLDISFEQKPMAIIIAPATAARLPGVGGFSWFAR